MNDDNKKILIFTIIIIVIGIICYILFKEGLGHIINKVMDGNDFGWSGA